ncbi:MAG: hypothetical protein ACKOZY_07880, partial [Flavobacteriales bacterium]
MQWIRFSNILFGILFALSSLSSCYSKRVMKEAQLYEQNNKLDMAYTLYDQVWYRKQKTDAQLARMAVAQKIFDQKCFLAEQGIAFSNFSEAKIQL